MFGENACCDTRSARHTAPSRVDHRDRCCRTPHDQGGRNRESGQESSIGPTSGFHHGSRKPATPADPREFSIASSAEVACSRASRHLVHIGQGATQPARLRRNARDSGWIRARPESRRIRAGATSTSPLREESGGEIGVARRSGGPRANSPLEPSGEVHIPAPGWRPAGAPRRGGAGTASKRPNWRRRIAQACPRTRRDGRATPPEYQGAMKARKGGCPEGSPLGGGAPHRAAR